MTPTNHSPEKVLLGTTLSSDREVSYEPGSAATFVAGLAVCRNSDGELSLDSSDGGRIGISLGISMSDNDKCAVVRSGLKVPVRLQDDNVFSALTKNELTFTSKIRGTAGDAISITFTDTATAGEESVSVDELAITVEMDDTSETGSTAAQIKAAIDAHPEASALISVEISEGDDAVVQDDFVEDFLENGVDAYEYVEIGGTVEFDGSTGEACEDDEVSGATYVSLPLSGIDPLTGLEVCKVALIDMPGGL